MLPQIAGSQGSWGWTLFRSIGLSIGHRKELSWGCTFVRGHSSMDPPPGGAQRMEPRFTRPTEASEGLLVCHSLHQLADKDLDGQR